MSKIMTLEVLSSIKGAKASAAVDQLFEAIKRADIHKVSTFEAAGVEVSALRPDEVLESSEEVQELIRANFPKEKNGFLVVAKVIEE